MAHSIGKKITQTFFFLGCLFLVGFFVTPTVNGATLMSVTHELNRLKKSSPANHTLTLTTPSGVLSGQNIQVHLPADFSALLLVQSDIEIYDDGVLLAGGADWTFATTSLDMTFSFVTPVTPGSVLEIRIGDHAVSGTNQIINPTMVGSFTITVDGTFGDIGTTLIPIIDDDQVTVTAEVASPPTTTGGGGSSGGSCVSCLYDFGNNDPAGEDLIDDPVVEPETEVVFRGSSHANGDVFVYYNGILLGRTKANSSGEFIISFSDFPVGVNRFSFIGEDTNGERSAPYVIDVPFTEDSFLLVEDIFIAPTINFNNDDPYFNENEPVIIDGYTVPNTAVSIFIDGQEKPITILSDENGYFEYTIDGVTYGDGYHSVILEASFNNLTSFMSNRAGFVREGEVTYRDILDENRCLRGDINRDNIVNLQDLSIVAYWKNKTFRNENFVINERECLNNDGGITFADFSVIAAAWHNTFRTLSL